MAIYPMKCDNCKIKWDVKLSFAEHTAMKGKIVCPDCGEIATQMVAPLNFKLAGEGWFGSNADAVASPYGITQTEINKNLEGEKRVEDYANTMSARDENRKEI